MDRRIDALIAEHPHWSNYRRLVSRIARLMLRQEVLDRELKQKGLLVKGTGAPKDALELDFKIEGYIRRYIEMLPSAEASDAHRGPITLTVTTMRACPHCGEELMPGVESVFDDEEMTGSTVDNSIGEQEQHVLEALAPAEQAASPDATSANSV